MADLPFSSTQILAGLASILLLFVSGGVIYLSAVEWRDRRRRAAAARPEGGSRRAAPPRGKSKAFTSATGSSPARTSARPPRS